MSRIIDTGQLFLLLRFQIPEAQCVLRTRPTLLADFGPPESKCNPRPRAETRPRSPASCQQK
jgi:hypothetical protein